MTRLLVSRKGQKERKGNFKQNDKLVVTPAKKLQAGPKPETECLHCKGNGHWKRKCPEYLVDKKDGKVNKGIFDIQVIYSVFMHNNALWSNSNAVSFIIMLYA